MNKKIIILFLSTIFLVCIIISKINVKQFNDINDEDSKEEFQWYIENLGEFKIQQPNVLAWGNDEYVCSYGVDINYHNNELKETDKKVVIAVIDTPIYIGKNHFAKYIWQNDYEISNDLIDNDKNNYVDDKFGWNFCNNSSNISSKDIELTEHATFINGMLLGKNKEYLSILGNNSNISIMSLVVMDKYEEYTDIKNIVNAILYAEENGAKICNISLAIYENYSELKDVMEKSNMLFVVAAGNDGMNISETDKCYPSLYKLDNVISVADIRCDGKLSKTSNYGNYVDIAAPGTDILSIYGDKEYTFKSGTSFSAAIVTACAALLYSKSKSDISPYEVKKIINQTCVKTSDLKGKVACGGYINFDEAIKVVTDDR